MTPLLAGDNVLYLNCFFVLFNNIHNNQSLTGMFKGMKEEILKQFQQAQIFIFNFYPK